MNRLQFLRVTFLRINWNYIIFEISNFGFSLLITQVDLLWKWLFDLFVSRGSKLEFQNLLRMILLLHPWYYWKHPHFIACTLFLYCLVWRNAKTRDLDTLISLSFNSFTLNYRHLQMIPFTNHLKPTMYMDYVYFLIWVFELK